MARNRRTADQDAHIVVTDAAGAVKILIRSGPNNVVIAPTTGQTQVVTVGDTAERADQRTPQVIWTDQQGGMGQFAYTETEGIETFTDSQCDTRYPGLIVLPPAATQLGGAVGAPNLAPSFVEAIGRSTCYVLAWAHFGGALNGAWRYDQAANTWSAVQQGGTNIGNVTGFALFRNYYLFASTTASVGLYLSTDGVTWTASAKAKDCQGICTHDNKVFVFNATDSTLDWALDPTAAHASWSKSRTLWLHPQERVNQLLEWRDASGRTVVYLITTRRILWYDADADEFMHFYSLTDLIVPTEAWPRAEVSPRDGNLYVTLFSAIATSTSDTVLWFSGTTNVAGPNLRGGLPTTSRLNLLGARGSQHWLYAFGYPREAGQFGRVLAMNDQQGFHTVYEAGQTLIGGGYGRGNAYALTHDGTTARCYEIAVPDSTELPLFASRTYRTGATYYHEYAYTDGGTPNMPKNARWVAVQSLDHTTAGKVPGLASGCQIVVQYRRDTENTWTTLGTLTSASVFPAVLPFPDTFGTFKQLKIRIGLSSIVAARTPAVPGVALAYLRQEVRREAVTVVADLADDERDFYAGQDRAQLWQRIKGWAQPGQIVALAFAGGDDGSPPATASSYSACTVEFSEYQDSQSGPGQVTLQFTDVSAPASG